MANMFYGCTSLKNLIISNFNFNKASFMVEILKGLKELEYIDI